MRHYELVLLVHPDQSEQVPEMINRYQETVKKSDGIIHRTEDIGRMPLAYTIEDMHKAHYVLMNIESNEGVISELESLFKFNDSIMRHLIVKMKKAETGDSKLFVEKEDSATEIEEEKDELKVDEEINTETKLEASETEQEPENTEEEKVEEKTDEKKEG